ncbi:MAG: aminopeptidase P N-terminal domain-containing protein [Bacteroidota bacterium]|nr:aminopeptidase P N-terminal domain-containing protein [Bacteroidota bacterium]
MRYSTIPQQLFEKNRIKLTQKLKPHSLAILHSNDQMPRNGDQFFPFRQNSDLFYLCGIDQEKTILTLCPGHPEEKFREVLFILKTDPKTELYLGHKLTQEEARAISGVNTVYWLDEFDKVYPELKQNSEYGYTNLDENNPTRSDSVFPNLRFAEKIRSRFPLFKQEKLAPLMTELRMVKEPEEMKIIEQACSITDYAFRNVLKMVKPGIFEYEVEAELTRSFLQKGSTGHAFAPIAASGSNACVLHYSSNGSVCQEGDLLLMDFGAEQANYASDCSRTIPVSGVFSNRQKQLYQAVLRVLKRAELMIHPGISIEDMNKDLQKIWEEEHISLGLYTRRDLEQQDPEKPLYKTYFPHGVSHHMGLDVHDVGSKDVILQPGMVITFEPGIYIREEGTGIRLENDYLVTGDTAVNLMKNIPVEIEDIEQLMK